MTRRVLTAILFVLTLSSLHAQQKLLKVSNPEKKDVLIKEYKRIILTTKTGLVVAGRYRIASDQSIAVNNEVFMLSDISEIRRDRAFIGFLSSGAMIYVGAVTAGVSVLIGAFGNPAGFYLLIPAAALIYTGIKSPKISRKYSTEKGWSFEIVNNQ